MLSALVSLLVVAEGGRPAAQALGVTPIGPATYEIGSGSYLFEAKP